MLAISNTISNYQLLTACAVLALLYVLHGRRGAGRLGAYLVPGLAVMALVLVIATRWWPTAGSFTEARNHRLAITAAEQADREVPQSDCLVVLDGSSVFAYGVDIVALRNQFVAAGHKPCIISLSIAGGDHFEREYMTEQAWRLMRPETHKALAEMPVLWVKELHWHYDSRPARVIATNPDTARALTLCDPARAARMASVVWTSREVTPQMADDDEGFDSPETTTGLIATLIRHGAFNLFHAGHAQRLVDGPSQALRLRTAAGALENQIPVAHTQAMMELLPASGIVYEPSPWHAPPAWFVEMLKRTPSGWDRSRTKTLLVMLPALSPAENTYAAQIVHIGGFGPALPMLLGPQDVALRKKLDDPACWRDAVHLKKAGTTITTMWLADHLLQQLPPSKPGN